MRVPPNVVRSTTMPSGSAAISPMTRRVTTQRMCPHRAAARRRPPRARRRRPPCPRWPRISGSMPSRSHAPFTAGRTGSVGLVEDDGQAESRASSLHTVPTPPRVGIAQPPGRRRGGQERVDQHAHGGGVGADVGSRARGRRARASRPCRGRRWCPRRARRRPGARGRHRACGRRGSTPTPGGGDEHAVGRARARPPWCRR